MEGGKGIKEITDYSTFRRLDLSRLLWRRCDRALVIKMGSEDTDGFVRISRRTVIQFNLVLFVFMLRISM